MKAFVLAAGLGTRLRPLTQRTPKPLIEVGGRPLLAHHLERLAEAGFTDVVINTAHLARQIHDFVGTGSRWGLRIRFSYEGDQPLDTGGGMLKALALLGPEPFLAVNADIVTDYPFRQLPSQPRRLAHLVLVPNPDWRGGVGDFVLQDGMVTGQDASGLTFAGIGVYHPRLLSDHEPGTFSIVPLLRAAMAKGQVTGECYDGLWHDTGTPERLEAARASFAA